MDTMVGTKIVGALCGSLLILLLGGFFGELIYHVGDKHHGDDHHQAYTIDTGEEDHDDDVVEVAFADVYAAADVGKGERVFGKCKSCHSLEDGKNGAGPSLHAVVDRAVEASAGFNYSGALSSVVDAWSADELNAFLENPKGYAPGTSMGFKGLAKVEDRANVIAYLETIK